MNGDVNYDQLIQYSNVVNKSGLAQARAPILSSKYRYKRPFSMISNGDDVQTISKKFKSHSGYENQNFDKKAFINNGFNKNFVKVNVSQDVEMKSITDLRSPSVVEQKK